MEASVFTISFKYFLTTHAVLKIWGYHSDTPPPPPVWLVDIELQPHNVLRPTAYEQKYLRDYKYFAG